MTTPARGGLPPQWYGLTTTRVVAASVHGLRGRCIYGTSPFVIFVFQKTLSNRGKHDWNRLDTYCAALKARRRQKHCDFACTSFENFRGCSGSNRFVLRFLFVLHKRPLSISPHSAHISRNFTKRKSLPRRNGCILSQRLIYELTWNHWPCRSLGLYQERTKDTP